MKQLEEVIDNHRKKIEESHDKGNIPSDYSLGIINGLILSLNVLTGSCQKFYDRTTAIGTLPKPVVLRAGRALGAEDIYNHLQERALLAARNFISSDWNKISEDKGQKLFYSLEKAIEQMDKFATEKEEFERAQNDFKKPNAKQSPKNVGPGKLPKHALKSV